MSIWEEVWDKERERMQQGQKSGALMLQDKMCQAEWKSPYNTGLKKTKRNAIILHSTMARAHMVQSIIEVAVRPQK